MPRYFAGNPSRNIAHGVDFLGQFYYNKERKEAQPADCTRVLESVHNRGNLSVIVWPKCEFLKARGEGARAGPEGEIHAARAARQLAGIDAGKGREPHHGEGTVRAGRREPRHILRPLCQPCGFAGTDRTGIAGKGARLTGIQACHGPRCSRTFSPRYGKMGICAGCYSANMATRNSWAA